VPLIAIHGALKFCFLRRVELPEFLAADSNHESSWLGNAIGCCGDGLVLVIATDQAAAGVGVNGLIMGHSGSPSLNLRRK